MKFDLETIREKIKTFDPQPTGDPFLDGRYDWQRYDNAVEWLYYRFFYWLAKTYDPRLVVELGGFQGTAAAHFAMGQKAGNPEQPGKTITIDHHTDLGDELNQVKMNEAVAYCHPNLIYAQGWTTQYLAQEQRGNHARGDAPSAYPIVLQAASKIDILFIDSWHVYEYAKEDWEAYSPLLNSPALVICDDILDENRPGFPISGMREFWEELPGEKFLEDRLHPGSRMGFLKYG